MKTDELIDLLARGPVAADPRAAGRTWGMAAALGAVCATVLVLLALGLRPDLAQAAHAPMFWGKAGFVAALALLALPLGRRLGRPGARAGLLGWAPVLPVLALWALAFAALGSAAPQERAALVLGTTWAVCPVAIVVLSLPGFVLAMRAMARMAPTRLRAAGAVAGLLSGAIGATAYSLHCPEMAAPFLAVWYVGGVLAVAALGALLGPRVLRW